MRNSAFFICLFLGIAAIAGCNEGTPSTAAPTSTVATLQPRNGTSQPSPVPGGQSAQMPIPSTPTPPQWIQMLKGYAKEPKGKGQVVVQNGQETLLIETKKGIKPFLSLNALPKMACRGAKRPLREATWWYFDGPNPVALQLTPRSADFWRFDAMLGCLASSIAFEATYKEMGAAELLNMWVYYDKKNPNNIENARLPLPKAHLVKKRLNKIDRYKGLSHQITLGGKPTTIQLSFKDALVIQENDLMLNVLFGSGDFSTEENAQYAVAMASVLRNLNGAVFVKVASQYDMGEPPLYDEIQRFRVYEMPVQGIPFLIAERYYREGSSKGNDGGVYHLDENKIHRTYRTTFGEVVHHIEKYIETEKGRQTYEKNETKWFYQTEDGIDVELFKFEFEKK